MDNKRRLESASGMTKSEEINFYRQFVESLPSNSYLADYFRGSVDVVAYHIERDLPCPDPVAVSRAAAREAIDKAEQERERLAKLLQERERLEQECRRHCRELDRINEGLDRVLHDIHGLNRAAADLRSRLAAERS